jgi:hypothetical protein
MACVASPHSVGRSLGVESNSEICG